MIVYVDSSVLARAYLADETGHEEVGAMLHNPDMALITGTWTRVEVSGALVRAARAARGDEQGLLALLDADLAPDGPVTVVAANQEHVETAALQLVVSTGSGRWMPGISRPLNSSYRPSPSQPTKPGSPPATTRRPPSP